MLLRMLLRVIVRLLWAKEMCSASTWRKSARSMLLIYTLTMLGSREARRLSWPTPGSSKVIIRRVIWTTPFRDWLLRRKVHDLSQRALPSSYKFYDPILSIIQNELPKDRKQHFTLLRRCSIERVYHEDSKRKFMETIGLSEPAGESKLVLK